MKTIKKKVYKAGTKSRGLCMKCKEVVDTTLKNKNTKIKELNLTVAKLLVAVCDQCQAVVSIPQQSFKKIAQARKSKSKKSTKP